MRITRKDIRLIKSMGFEFVKLIVNPERLLSDKGPSDATRWYLREIVQIVVDEGLPVVVCIIRSGSSRKGPSAMRTRSPGSSRFLEETGRSWPPVGDRAVGTAVDDGTRRQRPRLE